MTLSADEAEMAHQESLASIPDPERRGAPSKQHRLGPSLLTASVLSVLAIGGILYWHQGSPKPAGAAGQVARASVPVTVDVASRRDVPIYLSGLGTVQASETVAIRSQVDGKLASVGFHEGQEVHRGDVLAMIDPSIYQAQLDQALAKKAQDEAQLANAKADLERYVRLVQSNAGTRQQVDTQTALVAQLTAQGHADDAAIESARTYLGYTKIVSPIDGRTGVRMLDSGNIIHASDSTPIVIVTRTKPVNLLFSLPQRNLGAVRDASAKGSVSVLAFDQDGKRPLGEGSLMLIDNQIDQLTSSIRLKATFANDSEALWPGQFVSVRLLSEIRKDALTIPLAAVQRGPQGLFAWVVRDNSTAELKPIKIDDGAQAEVAIVKDGIVEGDHIVVAGQYRLQPGVHVDATAVANAPSGRPS
jgi:multidrug efflux system membrane fusion protein